MERVFDRRFIDACHDNNGHPLRSAREEERRRELTKLSHQDNLVFDSARGAPKDFKSVSLAGEG